MIKLKFYYIKQVQSNFIWLLNKKLVNDYIFFLNALLCMYVLASYAGVGLLHDNLNFKNTLIV